MSKKKKRKILMLVCALITSIILFIIVCVLFLGKDKKQVDDPQTSSISISSTITEESSMLIEGETYSIKNVDGVRIFSFDTIYSEYKKHFIDFDNEIDESEFKILESVLVSSKYNISGIEGSVVDFRVNVDEGFYDVVVLTEDNILYCSTIEANDTKKKKDMTFIKLETDIKINKLIGPYYYGVADLVVPINKIYAVSSADKIYEVTYEYEDDNNEEFKYILNKKDNSIFSFASISGKIDKDGYISLYMNSALSFREITSFKVKELIEVINGNYYVITDEDYLYEIKLENSDSSLDSSYELINDNKIVNI